MSLETAASSLAEAPVRRRMAGASIGASWRNGLFILPFLGVYIVLLV
jgi:multiple sugar transport system permease protein